MSEGKLSAVWDRCLAAGIVKTGAGDKICQPLLLCLSTAPRSFLHPDLTAIWFCDYSLLSTKHHRRRLGFIVLSGSLQETIVASDLWAWNRLWHSLLELPTWGFWLIIAFSRAPLLFLRSWVALSFKVCPCVRYPPVLALYHQFRTEIANLLTQYHQVPTIAVLYWPSTTDQGFQLQMLPLVIGLLTRGIICNACGVFTPQ